MRFINGVVILFVLTICAWKCGQANAAPAFYKNQHIQEFSIDSIDTRDKVVLNNKQTMNVRESGSPSGVWYQIARYGRIKADRGIFIDLTQTVHGLEPHGEYPFDGEIYHVMTLGPFESDGPIIIAYTVTYD